MHLPLTKNMTKSRIDCTYLKQGLTLFRGAANARERTRMRVLSRAFGRLKLTLPWVPPDTKLSKLDTLRLATSYIAHLKRILQTSDAEESSGDDAGTEAMKLTRQDMVSLRKVL